MEHDHEYSVKEALPPFSTPLTVIQDYNIPFTGKSGAYTQLVTQTSLKPQYEAEILKVIDDSNSLKAPTMLTNYIKTPVIVANQTQNIVYNYITTDQTYAFKTIPILEDSDKERTLNYTTMTNVIMDIPQHEEYVIETTEIPEPVPNPVVKPAVNDYKHFPFKCDLCPNEFKQKFDMEVHRKIHMIERVHVKPTAKKVATVSKPRAVPKRLITEDSDPNARKPIKKPPYLCSTCNHFFTNRLDLVIHEKIHEPLIDYACDFCSKRFLRKDKLVAHVALHGNSSGGFHCEKCEKSFKSQRLLVTHQKTHVQSRNFTCSICEKGFISEQNLVAHNNMHSGESKLLNNIINKTEKILEEETYPYTCRVCNSTFETKISLQFHIKTSDHFPKK